ncbi:MAG TPA: Tm-1-like ATP-binding domain-containing protein, partial [Acidobacteriota bacterium]|nr:Tm-1-like ATP-binding domain-containing protein [Acidobacteriota bacterium]
ELAELGGGDRAGVAAMLMHRREQAIAVMVRGLTAKLSALHAAGELHGIIAVSGMTGALIALPAMKAMPFGLPKLLVSGAVSMPIHAEKFAEYFALNDITVMHAVVDTVGMNALVRTLAMNGANAISGMVEKGAAAAADSKPSIALTEFGFCDKGAHYIRELLRDNFEIVSFHAQGLGDRAAMELIPQSHFRAFIDLVPGAFSEYLLGGNRGIAGPGRLEIVSRLAIPYILCPGGFDMISCGPIERSDGDDSLWKSRNLAERKLYIQEHPRVQARMSAGEMESVASAAADSLNRYIDKSRVKVVIPTRGFSSLSVEGGPLSDAESDKVFAAVLKLRLDFEIEVIEIDTDINSPVYAKAVTDTLLQMLRARS